MRAMSRTNVSRLPSVSAASWTDSWGEGENGGTVGYWASLEGSQIKFRISNINHP